MGLRSGGDVVAAVGSSCNGGGGGHTLDPVMGDPWSASLASDLNARVPMGVPCTPTWILAVLLGAGLGGESSTDVTSTGSSSSSSSAMVTPSPSFLGLSDESSICLGATGRGKGPNHGCCKGAPDDLSERWPGLRVSLTNTLVSWGREIAVSQEP
jgi:hypothetical protein